MATQVPGPPSPIQFLAFDDMTTAGRFLQLHYQFMSADSVAEVWSDLRPVFNVQSELCIQTCYVGRQASRNIGKLRFEIVWHC